MNKFNAGNAKLSRPISGVGFSATITLILYSCGRWSDNIHLSIKSAEFSGDGDSLVVNTFGTSWWLCEIKVDDSLFYNFDGIDVFAKKFIVKQDCFLIERRGSQTLFIKLDPNPLAIKRIVIVGLESGDYFDRVTITQNPK